MINPMDMTGRRVMVTGAGSGIGSATAVLLADLGASLILVGRDRDKLQHTVGNCSGAHAIEPFDLSQSGEIVNWMRNIAERHGPLDGLVHCAGIQIHTPLRSLTLTSLERLLAINTVSSAMLIKAMQYVDCGAARASIVMAASLAAIVADPANGAYGASKAAVMAMVRTFAIELIDRGIRLNAVAPAMVETEMVQEVRDLLTPEAFAALQKKHPMGLGRPEDVANGIVFLLSDAARWITGLTLVLDGGASAL